MTPAVTYLQKVTDSSPHPRVLFEEVPEELYEELAPLAATSARIREDDPIHASDWDLLVTFARDAGVREQSLHVLSFGAGVLDLVARDGSGVTLERNHTTRARAGVVSHGLPSALSELLNRTVVANVVQGEKRTWGLSWGPFGEAADLTDDLGGSCRPLVHVGRERYVYALRRERGGEYMPPTLCWGLPGETTEHRVWLLYVLSELRTHDPERFPSDPAWQTRETWATPALRDAMRARAQWDAEFRIAQERFEQRRRELAGEIERELTTAASGMWRLLTAKGDELVEAAGECFESLGFVVRHMDDHHDAVTGAKLEDLRVTDPEDPDWECLVEVKGYAKGARVNDVPQITMRPSVNYALETGHAARSVWHVVNAFAETDPAARPIAIPADPDLKPLADAGGALIDTRDLFAAWRDVVDGECSATEIRHSLRVARVRWSPPRASCDAGAAEERAGSANKHADA